MSNECQEYVQVKYKTNTDEQKKLLIKLVVIDGITVSEASKITGINNQTCYSILKKFKITGSFKNNIKGGNKNMKITEEMKHFIEKLIEINSSITLKDIKENIYNNYNISISLSSIYRILLSLKITLKKASIQLERVNEEIYIDKRKEYALWFNNSVNGDVKRCIFIDECSFNLHIRRTMARSKSGDRATIVMPTIRGRSITYISSLTCNGISYSKFIEDGTNNSTKFELYFRELCTELSRTDEYLGSFLILDNARIHRKNYLNAICNEYGFQLKFLSPYSYMLNPIENSFSKIKIYARNALSNNLQNLTLKEIIVEAASKITPGDSMGYYMNMLSNIAKAIDRQKF